MTIALKHVVIAGTLWGLVCTGIVWQVGRRLHPPRAGIASFAGSAPASVSIPSAAATNGASGLVNSYPTRPPAQD